jgi:hypothetical protein
MSEAFRVRGYRLDRNRLQLAIVAPTVALALWILTDLGSRDQPTIPVAILVWLFGVGLLVALSVEREDQDSE